MIKRRQIHDYETVARSPKKLAAKAAATAEHFYEEKDSSHRADPEPVATDPVPLAPGVFLKRGHVLTFASLFLFTLVLYARPSEFYPSPLTTSLALIIGSITLFLFATTQIALEGKLTARPREVNLVLLFLAAGLLSIPLAIDPAIAWTEFSGTFVRGVLIFVVIINVVRTPQRLNALLFLSLVTAVVLSLQAINDYRLGLNTIEGYRAAGRGSGIFGNTNDMALFLVTMLPISVAFFFGSKNRVRKTIHAACAAMIIFGIILSYSRGAFLGVLVVFGFFAVRIGRRSKFEIALLIMAGAAAMILLAPSGYGDRLLSILLPGMDPNGSADARRGELFRSIYVALRHPLLGIGMGNYQPNMSYKGLVTHNSYTQVASEMGILALTIYTMFIVAPLRKLSVIVRQTLEGREDSPYHYLALGLQASLLVFLVSSTFLAVAYAWNVYYLVGYAVCLRRIYESNTGQVIVVEKRKRQGQRPESQTVAQQPAIA
jgi:putative inorganic carbon (HCO3(-)) transporter